MTTLFDSFAQWLADYYFLSSVLLVLTVVALVSVRQPANRRAITQSTLIGLFMLAALCAIPGWSLLSLTSAPPIAAIDASPAALRHDTDHFRETTNAIDRQPVVDNTPPALDTQNTRVAPIAPASPRRIPWPSLVIFAWTAGAVCVIAWLAVGMWAANRLFRDAQPAPPDFVAMLRDLERPTRHRPAELLTSSRIDVAVALGVRRSAVLLPADWLQTQSPDDLRTVLAHEAAHLRNHDLHWLAVSRVLNVLLWAQPLFWFLRRRMRLDQEALADAAAAELTSRDRYAERLVALAHVAAARPTTRLVATVGLWEGPSQLRRRVAILIDERFAVIRKCSRRWQLSAAFTAGVAVLLLSLITLESAHTRSPADDQPLSPAMKAKVAAAISVLRETKGTGDQTSMRVLPNARVQVADDWAESIRTLVEIGKPAVPMIIEALNQEDRDHAISKLAFALRAIGDPRAVPALIRAIPRTLLPGRSDFGLMIENQELLKFMQQHDFNENDNEKDFSYGRAFREVVGTLHKLTGTDQNDMELNFVHLKETESQRKIQQKLFQQLAERWERWWLENWRRLGVDSQYAIVNLPKLPDAPVTDSAVQAFPVGDRISLTDRRGGSIVQSAHESKEQCFLDLDTGRRSGWPQEIPQLDETGADGEQILHWARKEGFDFVCITQQPPGRDKPLYCLKPLDMKVWQITPEEQEDLPLAMKGESPYPLARPVELMVPVENEYEGPNKHELGGTAFLFLTREGTAGLLRMTAQVTDTNVPIGRPWSPDTQFSPVGLNRGARISTAIISQVENAPLDIRIKAAPILASMAEEHGYALAPGKDVARIAPPFAPIRMDYYRTGHPSQAEAIPRGPDAMVFRWVNKRLLNWGMTFGDPADPGYSLTGVLDALLDIKSQQLEGPNELLDKRLPGDWVIRPGVDKVRVVEQLEEILRTELSLPVSLEFREVKRRVFVVRGKYQFAPLSGDTEQDKLIPADETFTGDKIQIFGKQLVPNSGAGGTGNFDEFLSWLGRWIGTPVVSEIEKLPTDQISWLLHERSPSTDETREEDHDPKLVLPNITAQTGLEFALDVRPIEILFVESTQVSRDAIEKQ